MNIEGGKALRWVSVPRESLGNEPEKHHTRGMKGGGGESENEDGRNREESREGSGEEEASSEFTDAKRSRGQDPIRKNSQEMVMRRMSVSWGGGGGTWTELREEVAM